MRKLSQYALPEKISVSCKNALCLHVHVCNVTGNYMYMYVFPSLPHAFSLSFLILHICVIISLCRYQILF